MGVGCAVKCVSSSKMCIGAIEPSQFTRWNELESTWTGKLASFHRLEATRMCRVRQRKYWLGILVDNRKLLNCWTLFPFKLEVWKTLWIHGNEQESGKELTCELSSICHFRKILCKRKNICNETSVRLGMTRGKMFQKYCEICWESTWHFWSSLLTSVGTQGGHVACMPRPWTSRSAFPWEGGH